MHADTTVSGSCTQKEPHARLRTVGADAPLQLRRQVGLNHMAWRLESLDDLAEFYGRIKAQGQPIERIVDHGISLGIYFRDPDGNLGELVTPGLWRNY